MNENIERQASLPLQLTLPTLALIAGTRVALGIGIGLLLAHQLNRQQCRSTGTALVAIGVLSTIPLVAEVFSEH